MKSTFLSISIVTESSIGELCYAFSKCGLCHCSFFLLKTQSFGPIRDLLIQNLLDEALHVNKLLKCSLSTVNFRMLHRFCPHIHYTFTYQSPKCCQMYFSQKRSPLLFYLLSLSPHPSLYLSFSLSSHRDKFLSCMLGP